MSDTDWLRELLLKMQDDVDEIKEDVRLLHDFKLKIAGAAIAISTIVSVVLGIIGLIIKH